MHKTLQDVVTVLHPEVVVDLVLILVEHARVEIYRLHVVEALHTDAETEIAEQPQ